MTSHLEPPHAGPGEVSGPTPPNPTRLAEWAPSRTQVLALVIGLLAASNIAQWIAVRKAVDARPVTVVAVRQMTRDYINKAASPALSEQESILRANLFIATAQDELRQLVSPGRLVLARECVLSGTLNDITGELQKRVEARLAQDGAPPSPGAAPVATPAGDPITGGRISAANLLSPSAATVDRTAP